MNLNYCITPGGGGACTVNCSKNNLRWYLTNAKHPLDFSIFLIFFFNPTNKKAKHKQYWIHQYSPNKIVNAIHMQMSQHSPTKIYKTFHQLKFTFSLVHLHQHQNKNISFCFNAFDSISSHNLNHSIE